MTDAAREARRAMGLCIFCGRNPARPNRCACFECALKHSEYNARKYLERKRMLGLHPLPIGHQREWVFSVEEDGREVFRGIADEVADFLHCAHCTVYLSAGKPRIVGGKYRIFKYPIGGDANG